jgi:uncharacterized membrane protein
MSASPICSNTIRVLLAREQKGLYHVMMRAFLVSLLVVSGLFIYVPLALAQTAQPDTVTFLKAKVTAVLSSEVKQITGTETKENYQKINAEILEGADRGKVITVDNDYLILNVGDEFYLRHEVNTLDSTDFYSVGEPYRIPVLEFFVGLFIVCLFVFGGKQGVRGLISLIASLFFIGFLLLPGILAGYNPVLVSMGVSALIIILGSYVTHGFNRTTTAAVIGMLATIAVTGLLAYLAIHWGHFSGYTNEETVYLNFDTTGSIDFVGLLLGSIMIGLLGVLYDAGISQAVAVEELLSMGEGVSRNKILSRAMRIGREHVGALVNTLAIAYVGASLPLLLLFKVSNTEPIVTVINQELFATEIIRTMIGSIGLILAVPITTLVAVYMLHGKLKKSPHQTGEGHSHGHSH